MSSDAAFVIDDTSGLGRRARALLAGAGLTTVDGGARVLLVDAGDAALERALQAGAARVVYVEQALPLAGDPQPQSLGARQGGAIRVRAQPYLEGLLPRLSLGLASGRFLSAAASQKVAYVAHEDAAILAAALLASDGSEAAPLNVTGPSALSHRELCAMISEQFGRRVYVEELPLERLSTELMRRGMSAEQATLSARADQLAQHGQCPAPSADGPRVTGVAALTVQAFLDRTSDTLRAAARTRRITAELSTRPGNATCAPINAP